MVSIFFDGYQPANTQANEKSKAAETDVLAAFLPTQKTMILFFYQFYVLQ